eukprot:GGOE01008486.1.p3 GENE.GGOE01008486.1~~GGOE01008486.1.p3  ORF type:complete len:190 (-),score=7.36 GGOE01008486.1:635-1204(-)
MSHVVLPPLHWQEQARLTSWVASKMACQRVPCLTSRLVAPAIDVASAALFPFPTTNSGVAGENQRSAVTPALAGCTVCRLTSTLDPKLVLLAVCCGVPKTQQMPPIAQLSPSVPFSFEASLRFPFSPSLLTQSHNQMHQPLMPRQQFRRHPFPGFLVPDLVNDQLSTPDLLPLEEMEAARKILNHLDRN